MATSLPSTDDTGNKRAETRADIVRVAIALALLAALASFDGAEDRGTPLADLASTAAMESSASQPD